jgi:hypothetical protein
MDLSQILRDLVSEKDRLERVIALLQGIEGNPSNDRAEIASEKTRKGRGRKSMGPAERQQVSQRMQRYWESKKRGSPGSFETSDVKSLGSAHHTIRRGGAN